MNSSRITDMDVHELQSYIQRENLCVVYLYTPLCGTCKVGEKMLEVALTALGDASAVKCNVNIMGNLVFDWEVTSIPCLLVFLGGTIMVKEYAVRNVDYLYRLLKPYTFD